MTSTLRAGRALPLPVHLKIHLVAGHVCVTEKRGEADSRPEWETARWCVCVSLCVFADSIKASYMAHTATGRAAVPVAAACVCARDREQASASWLRLLCWDAARDFPFVNGANISAKAESRFNRIPFALWFVILPSRHSEEERLTSSASSLSLLCAQTQLSVHKMAAAPTQPTFDPVSPAENLFMGQMSPRAVYRTL